MEVDSVVHRSSFCSLVPLVFLFAFVPLFFVFLFLFDPSELDARGLSVDDSCF